MFGAFHDDKILGRKLNWKKEGEGDRRLSERLHKTKRNPVYRLLMRESETALEQFGAFAEGGFHRPAFHVKNASAENMKAVEPGAVGAFMSSEWILDRRQF
jgi:hypothetical protein